MVQAGPNPYLRTKVLTASPQELRLMLYEGAIKFCRQAVESLGKGNYESSFESLMRSQKIVLELSTSLRHDEQPDLCAKLSALYTYIYRRLVEANTKRQIAPIEESIKLLEFEKETWQMLMQKLADENSHGDVTGSQQTAISSFKG